MAHFARIDENNVVTDVIVIDNGMTMKDGIEDEATGASFCNKLCGGTWLKTSYNTWGNVHHSGGIAFRKNFAGIGFTYDPSIDGFIPNRPDPKWTLNTSTYLWEALPWEDENGVRYVWDYQTKQWVVAPVENV